MTCGARACARSTTPETRSSSWMSSIRSLRSSPRASSTRSETSRVRASSSTDASSSACCASSAGRRPSRRRSTFVRAAVSGVRSSCDASATRRRCAPTDVSSAASIALKRLASRPSSSRAVDVDAFVRFPVSATCSAAAVKPADRAQRCGGDERRQAAASRDRRCRRSGRSRSLMRSSALSVGCERLLDDDCSERRRRARPRQRAPAGGTSCTVAS